MVTLCTFHYFIFRKMRGFSSELLPAGTYGGEVRDWEGSKPGLKGFEGRTSDRAEVRKKTTAKKIECLGTQYSTFSVRSRGKTGQKSHMSRVSTSHCSLVSILSS